MGLDAKAKQILDELKAAGLPEISTVGVGEAREMALARAQLFNSPKQPMAAVDEVRIATAEGGVAARVYRPEVVGGNCLDDNPAIVFFHGGGWVICNLETHDAVCRALAAAARTVVVAVDYRLAPEHKYPAALDDCVAAARWAGKNSRAIGAGSSRIALVGDSAGGTLATAAAMRIRDEGTGPDISAQVLVVPVTDYYRPGTPSYFEYAEDYGLTRRSMIWFWDHYLTGIEQAEEALVSPLRAADVRGLPPALVITAECDPLRDEGELYAQKLRGAGVTTELVRYEGMIHGFFNAIGVYKQTQEAIDTIASFLERTRGPESRGGSGAIQ